MPFANGPAPVPSKTVLLLGAPGTGSLELADALERHLAADPPFSPAIMELSTLAGAVLASHAAKQEAALDRHRSAALTLLMGLDLPCPPGEQALQQATDARLRAALGERPARAGIGSGKACRRPPVAAAARCPCGPAARLWMRKMQRSGVRAPAVHCIGPASCTRLRLSSLSSSTTWLEPWR
jgi:hypothetical protein